jgi:rare lipoprotein A
MVTTSALFAAAVSGASLAGCGGSPSRRPNLPSGSTQAESASAADLDFGLKGGGPATTKAGATGIASWYGAAFAGKKTANGERFDPRAMTAAHRSLPFGTWVEVRRVDTGRTVRVRINDRGPWGDNRKVIDVSRAAADVLDIVGIGLTQVELRIVHGP